MNEQVSVLFRELADLPPAEREAIFAARGIPSHLRAEVESLLAFDSPDHSLTHSIGAAAQAATRAPAETCGPYRLLRLLGSGGMGTVYLAERDDGEIQQRVAIKMLHGGAGRDSWQERFLRERQLLASLNHPAVARVFDAGHIDRGRPYLVMEYIEGRPIDAAAEGMPLRDQLALFLKVCDGVAHAHSHLIIHRDLKPSNILVDASGQPKLLDFGIAKLLDETADQTQTAERLLTPGYASPEQLRGALQTTATDIYSLAAVLYKILTGRSPHQSATGELLTIDIVAGTRQIPPPRRLNRAVPADVDSILQKALRLQPEERYASVEALAADIRAFLESRPVHARSGNAWYRTSKFLRRYWIPVTAAALTLSGLSIGLYVANRERDLAQRRFVQVRQMAGKWIDLDTDVRRLRNSIPARKRIISTSLEYLHRIGAEVGTDPELRLDMASEYLHVARLQGVPAESNLGQFAEADESLRQAESLAGAVLSNSRYRTRALQISATIAYNRMILAGFQDRDPDAAAHARKLIANVEELKASGTAVSELQSMHDDAKRLLSRLSASSLPAGTAMHLPSAAPQARAVGKSLSAWGYNEYGQLGTGTLTDTVTPRQFAVDGIVELAAGWYHTLALRSDGTVLAWGRNSNGQLGSGSNATNPRPQRVPGLDRVVAIATGYEHSFAIAADGTLWTWGANFTGQLGNGKKIDSPVPIRVPGLMHVVAAAGGGAHSLAVLSDGTVWAWGYNSNGQIGSGDRDTTLPKRVPAIEGAVAVAAGGAFSVALKSDGTVWTWGMNYRGELGNGSNVDSTSPVRAAGLTRIVAISAGDHHALALKADGTVWAWGEANDGELGNGSRAASSIPVQVSGMDGVIQISAAENQNWGHNLALRSDGTVWAWGWNGYGELGNGSKANSLVPVQVSGIRGAIRIAAGGSHSLALLPR